MDRSAVFVNHFDGKILTREVMKAQKKVLLHQGAVLRRTAVQLIRSKKTPSRPGSPPRNIKGGLKKGIRYAYDSKTDSVFVGPVKYENSSAPRTLEHGGQVKLPQHFQRIRRFAPGLPGNAGGHGPATIRQTENAWTSPFGYGTKDPKFFGANAGWSHYTYPIWRKLRTEKEAENAERQYEILLALRKIRPTTKTVGKVDPRPFMLPALEKCKNKLVELWRNAVG
ncbi:MAG: hypothetical protein IJF17_00835 [Thermoguttaceae bacterium]|nr:hypothetical protein [Thermoguttaceae bacterium]